MAAGCRAWRVPAGSSGPGRADHQHIMPAAAATSGARLTCSWPLISRKSVRTRRARVRLQWGMRLDLRNPAKWLSAARGFDRDHFQTGDQRGFGRIRPGHKDALKSFCAAVAAIGSTPRACRTIPSSESSPTISASPRASGFRLPLHHDMPRRSAGRRPGLPCEPRQAPG